MSVIRSIRSYEDVRLELHPETTKFRLVAKGGESTEWLEYEKTLSDLCGDLWVWENRHIDDIPTRLLSELTYCEPNLNKALGDKFFPRMYE